MRRGYRTLLGAFVAALLLSASGVSVAATDAGAFLAELSREANAKLTDPSLSQTQKEENFGALFRGAFDVPAISRFVLGKHWKRATEEQQQAFMDAFEELHMRRFLPMFSNFSEDMIKVQKVQQDENNPSLFIVSSEIHRPEAETILVDWRIRNQSSDYKVLDIVAEGVSMAISLRHEYSAVVKNHGIDGLVRLIREKSAELAAQ